MVLEGPILLVILLVAIGFIIYATAKLKLHPFLALIVAAYGIGLAVRMPVGNIAGTITQGFGNLMTSIGLVIVFGTIIGVFLERSGAALRMAEVVLKVVGEKRPVLAMSIIGYITSIPVFCDSGFVILSSLGKSLARKSKVSMAAISVALATGLYATHVMVPPTPGPLAGAANLGVTNLGLVILMGLVVAIPPTIAGYFYAMRFKNLPVEGSEKAQSYDELRKQFKEIPGAFRSFAPLILPILLIAVNSIANFPSKPFGDGAARTWLTFIGTPVTALLIGTGLCLLLVRKLSEEVLSTWVSQALKDASVILIVTGAGGSLGRMLSQTPITKYLGDYLAQYNLGIFLPFVIAAAIKTAQGSSTVAIVTTSALLNPLLPAMGLGAEMARILVVMAVGAGSMVVSHANDSYFWVVTQFSGIDVSTGYKTQTMATLIQGIVAIAWIGILSLVLI